MGGERDWFPNLTRTIPISSVTAYSVKRGVVALQHAYPPSPHPRVVALVDVTLLLSTLTVTDTQVGEWVNVVGYVTASGDTGARGGKGGERRGEDGRAVIPVQAILWWSAGSVRIGEYERVLMERQRAEREV